MKLVISPPVAEERLAKPDAGDETRKIQDQVLKDIDELIKRLKNPPPPPPPDQNQNDQSGGGGSSGGASGGRIPLPGWKNVIRKNPGIRWIAALASHRMPSSRI